MSDLRDKLRRMKHEWMSAHDPEAETVKYYTAIFGKAPDFKDPKTINEKIHYLKLFRYADDKHVAECADKVKVRKVLENKGLSDILPGLIGVYDKASDIDFKSLPEKFVIKCNHGCGYNIICKNKSELDRAECIRKLNAWMKEDYWKEYTELHYKNIEKKILIEEYLGDDIETYKFYCFNGVPKFIYAMTMNGDDHYIDFFDTEWNHMDVKRADRPGIPDYTQIKKPAHLSEMLALASQLSSEFPLVRVDLYDLDKVYFSELTFTPAGGFLKLDPPETEREWGDWLTL